jgi:hypothetical protein
MRLTLSVPREGAAVGAFRLVVASFPFGFTPRVQPGKEAFSTACKTLREPRPNGRGIAVRETTGARRRRRAPLRRGDDTVSPAIRSGVHSPSRTVRATGPPRCLFTPLARGAPCPRRDGARVRAGLSPIDFAGAPAFQAFQAGGKVSVCAAEWRHRASRCHRGAQPTINSYTWLVVFVGDEKARRPEESKVLSSYFSSSRLPVKKIPAPFSYPGASGTAPRRRTWLGSGGRAVRGWFRGAACRFP